MEENSVIARDHSFILKHMTFKLQILIIFLKKSF